MVGTSSNIRIQFTVPRDNCRPEEKRVGKGTSPCVGAIRERGIGKTMKSFVAGRAIEVVEETEIASAIEIFNELLENRPMLRSWVGHKFTQLIHCVGDVGPGPATDKVGKSDKTSKLSDGCVAFYRRHVILSENKTRRAWSAGAVAAGHLSAFD